MQMRQPCGCAAPQLSTVKIDRSCPARSGQRRRSSSDQLHVMIEKFDVMSPFAVIVKC